MLVKRSSSEGNSHVIWDKGAQAVSTGYEAAPLDNQIPTFRNNLQDIQGPTVLTTQIPGPVDPSRRSHCVLWEVGMRSGPDEASYCKRTDLELQRCEKLKIRGTRVSTVSQVHAFVQFSGYMRSYSVLGTILEKYQHIVTTPLAPRNAENESGKWLMKAQGVWGGFRGCKQGRVTIPPPSSSVIRQEFRVD